MENLNKDVLILLALELDYMDIFKFCDTSSKINNIVCKNNNFWRNKLYKDYPNYDFQQKHNAENYKKIYQQMVIEKLIENTPDTSTQSYQGFKKPVFLKPEMINFLKNANFGNVIGTNIPINFLLAPLLEKGVLNYCILSPLFANHLKPYQVSKGKFTASPEMNRYLSSYFDEIEKREIEKHAEVRFNRNSFLYTKIMPIMQAGMLKGNPNKDVNPLLSKVGKIIKETYKQ
jgi:hypothetical protein